MLRINSHKMDLDLTVVGYIRKGRVVCPVCGGEHGARLKDGTDTVDPLYGQQGKGQTCEVCGTPLEQVAVAA